MKLKHLAVVPKHNHRRLTSVIALSLMLHACGALAVTRYVSTNGAHVAPYTSWINAATNIAQALNVCTDGDVILVSNGVHYCYQHTVNTSVEIRSLNGPNVTTIDNSQSWGLYLNNTSTLNGFTIQNGSNINSSSTLIYSNSTVKNCIFKENYAYRGGALHIAVNSMASNCLFTDNTSSNNGGAVYVLSGTSNRIYNCTFYNNRSANGAGGAIYANPAVGVECRNLLVYSNRSVTGTAGGIYASSNVMLRNCTIVYNQSSGHGGGVYGSVGAYNSIIYNNTAANSSWNNWNDSSGFTNCCIGWQSSPAILGENNITNNPAFIAPLEGNFQLTRTSPCVNTGINEPWMVGAFDLIGRRRISQGIVDRGAYEYISAGTIFKLH